MEMRCGQFIANNTEVAEAWELEKEKLPILPTVRVEGEMRSEEGGDGFNLSHQSTVSVSATWPGMGSLARSLSGELRG